MFKKIKKKKSRFSPLPQMESPAYTEFPGRYTISVTFNGCETGIGIKVRLL